MRVMGIDGGAERMGWAILGREDNEPVYLASGILRFPKISSITFQQYRLTLTKELFETADALFDLSLPDEVVTETVPAVGSFRGTQMYLVNVAMTVVHTAAVARGIPVYQIGATTVQSKLVGKRQKGHKISKVQVRNGVFKLLPELEARKSDWTKVFDEPDAIAVALTHLGFSNQG